MDDSRAKGKNAGDVKWRHEWKHQLNFSDMVSLRARLRAVMQPDPHARDGTYFIRSLYFDTPQDKALREKIDGVNRREKFRIRYYNLDPSLIHLEKKSKRDGVGTKASATITAEQTRKIIDGDIDWMLEVEKDAAGKDPTLLRELYCKMRYQGLKPRTIVDYMREPFTYPAGNVRVTLDYDLRTGLGVKDFLSPDCLTIPAGDAPIILEVKWDEFLPSVIRAVVQVPNRRAAAFSKYAQCRVYG